MNFWTLLGAAAVICGLIFGIKYGLRVYRGWKSDGKPDTLPELKAVGENAGVAGIGGLLVIVGLRLIYTAFALALIILWSTTAHAKPRAMISVCDQQGCRMAAAPPPMAMHPKVRANIAARPNVVASKTVRVQATQTQPVMFNPFGPQVIKGKANNSKVCAVSRGIGGWLMAPMNEYTQRLMKRCGTVVVKEWHQFWPNIRVNEAYGHSAGGDDVLGESEVIDRVTSIDPTILNPGCPRGNCKNYHAPINAVPLIICCGGYAARGAKNIRIPGTPSFIFAPGHLRAPIYALDRGAMSSGQ